MTIPNFHLSHKGQTERNTQIKKAYQKAQDANGDKKKKIDAGATL